MVMSPEQFIAQLADAVSRTMKAAGPTMFNVKRTRLDGSVFIDQPKSLPEIIAELRDTIAIESATKFQQFQIQQQEARALNQTLQQINGSMRELIRVLEENKKVGLAILHKKNPKNVPL